MSRIYEALQKAESERKLGGQEIDLRTPVEHIDQVPAPAAVADYETESSFANPRLVDDAHDAQVALGGGLNLSAIRRLPWNLSAARLPALLDRGPAIEQFRSLRSRIYEARDIRPIKTILI